jgi:hypothetical protein
MGVNEPPVAELDRGDLVRRNHLANGLVVAPEDRGDFADGKQFWGHR